MAFGDDVNTVLHLDQAEVILALGADVLFCHPGTLRYAHDFASKRRVRGEQKTMNRLYAVDSTPSATGAMADHRLRMRASEIAGFTWALAAELGVLAQQSSQPPETTPYADWIKTVVQDLQHHRGTSVVVAGRQQPPAVHALVHAMNRALGNVGQTVTYTAPVVARPVDQVASLQDLVQDMAAGRVEVLIILGGNPVYTAPADIDFAKHLAEVKTSVHLSVYHDETSALCQWHVPETHYLESWGDARAYDGTVSLIQPLIAPLYQGKSAYELLAVLMQQAEVSGHELVKAYWQGQHQGDNFENFWRTALHDGLIADTALPPKQVALRRELSMELAASPAPVSGLEIMFQADPTIWDGRFANNGWLQELPKPLSKLTWDNAALLSPSTAERLGLRNAEVIELHYQGRSVRAPVWILPGHADAAVTVHLGYGRWRAGRVGNGAGFNAYALRTSDTLWFGGGLELRKTGASYRLATTQHHHTMDGRSIILAAPLTYYLEHPQFVEAEIKKPQTDETMYTLYEYPGYAWGMTIDLTTCIGCNACVIACQAENNIPVVGKDEVIRGREMHWIRIDRYYKGSLDNPEVYQQPVPCMHCEKAPCEVVCPVYATVHDDEGLNDMIYNRCVGTRYCSNNCPYKVRRFNFLQYADFHTTSLKLLRNPEVTVRSRGVMEKCTYCVQRINHARITAKLEDRPIRDGEIVTACQAACPTGTIIFGNLNDPHSQVSRLKREPLNYALLAELNTRPRTTYLAKLHHPHAALRPSQPQASQRENPHG
jgi:molybdopterin-containing oxidoreductase family iron-sulfur binding subunit